MWRFEHKQEKAKGGTGCEGDVGSSSIHANLVYLHKYIESKTQLFSLIPPPASRISFKFAAPLPLANGSGCPAPSFHPII